MTTPTAGPRPRLVAKGPGDLLAVVPFRLGFHPCQSLVLLALDPAEPGGTRRPVGAVLRADLPRRVEDAGDLVDTAVATFLRGTPASASGERAAVVVVYDTTGATARLLRPGPAARAVLAHLRTVLAGSGVDVHDVLLVTRGRWRSLTCRDRACCPPHGVALGHAADSALVAEAVGGGLTAAPSRAAVLPDTDPVAPDLVRAAGHARDEAAAVPPDPAQRWVAVAAFAGERSRYEDPRARQRVDPVAAGRLLAALDDLAVRDAVLLDGSPAPESDVAVRALLSSGPAAADRGSKVFAALGLAPDEARTAAGARLARDLARHAPGAGGAGAWAVAAWLHWSGGDGVRSGACAEAALHADPGQRLARLVQRALEAGLAARGGPGARTGVVLPEPPPRGV